MARRVQVLASYTWSHSIGNLSSDISPDLPGRSLSNHPNPDLNRGDSDFDVRHSLNGAVIVELPGPRSRGLAKVLKNWRANTIFFARSALPSDVVTIETDTHRINYVGGQPLYIYGSQYPSGERYNPAGFAVTPSGQTGNLGRNVVRGFHAWQVDFALHRQIPLAEHASMEFRAEAFNILNHPNFANPADSTYLNTVLFPAPRFGIATAMVANGLSFLAHSGRAESAVPDRRPAHAAVCAAAEFF